MRQLLLVVAATALLSSVVRADPCSDCLNKGKHWCATNNQCDAKDCQTTIKRELNCPRLPDPAYAYNDTEARTKWAPLFASTNGNNPTTCFKHWWPTMTMYKFIHAECSAKGNGPPTKCHMYTSFDLTQKILVMAFRGTDAPFQLDEEIYDYFRVKSPFFDSGHVYEYFYEGFVGLWNAGLGDDIKTLKAKYPDFQLWVTGHSLGGALASVAASYVVKIGLFDPKTVRLLTIGQPRTGDYAYALWQSNTIPFSYRVVHHRDMVPHLPPQLMPDDDEMYHHRTEIWYNNDMKVGDPYNICQEADGPYCSNTQRDLSTADHDVYYNIQMPLWGQAGCPKLP